MLDQAEIKRVRRGGLGPNLPAAKWEFTVDLGNEPEAVWERIVGVVESLVRYDYDTWPSDQHWREALPSWLASTMMTPEECDRAMAVTPRDRWHDLPWEFRSWLDALRERDWKWWGFERSGRAVRLVLEITGIPPRVDAFRQILLASGARILSEEHD